MSQKFKALDKTHGRGVVVTAGALAGVSEIVATYPLDTIKTVMQVKRRSVTPSSAVHTHLTCTLSFADPPWQV